jgi:lipid-binding SYLF domain-containing protein
VEDFMKKVLLFATAVVLISLWENASFSMKSEEDEKNESNTSFIQTNSSLSSEGSLLQQLLVNPCVDD